MKGKKLVYLAAVAPDAGESIASIGKQYPMDNGLGNVLFKMLMAIFGLKKKRISHFFVGT